MRCGNNYYLIFANEISSNTHIEVYLNLYLMEFPLMFEQIIKKRGDVLPTFNDAPIAIESREMLRSGACKIRAQIKGEIPQLSQRKDGYSVVHKHKYNLITL